MTHTPRVSLFCPNGGDASTRYATPRKVERGFCHDLAIQLSVGIQNFRPYSFIHHGPWGWNDPANMELDSWPMTKADPKWAHLADVNEFVHAHLMMYELSVWLGSPMVMEFYLGAPEGSAILNNAWATNRGAWANRVDSCIKPIIALRDRGVPIRLWIDGAGARPESSQSAAVVERYRVKRGFIVGIEPRPHLIAEWANKPDIPVMTTLRFWHRSDPEKHADSAYAIPNGKLQGEQVLIVTEEDIRDAPLAELKAGRSVATIGVPPGYPTAEALAWAARNET